jgi:sulfite oxidase
VQRTPTPGDPRDVTQGEPLGAVALNAVIAEPAPGARVTAGLVRVRGWAIGGNCETLERVEVSPNGTDGWTRARLLPGASRWTWSFWEAEVDLPRGEHELAVRATDASGGRQPASLADVWNVKGYANNAWHRVRITAE